MSERLGRMMLMWALLLAIGCGASGGTGGHAGGASGVSGTSAGGAGGMRVDGGSSGSSAAGGSSAGASGGRGGTGGTSGAFGGGEGGAGNGRAGNGGGGDGSVGNGGTGGGTACSPGADCTAAALADHESIFGPIPEGAFYLFRAPYVRTSGNPPVVTAAINVADPGTRDLTFPNPPRWLPNGGPDGRGAARFDGIDDHGTAGGFSFGIGSSPSILVVLQFDDVDDRIAVPVQLHDGSRDGRYFLNAAQIRTMTGDIYRANGNLIGVPHNIDYLTPQASSDTLPHLHETHAYSDGMVAVYDGRIFGGGGGDGLAGPIDTLQVGSNAIGSQHAAVQISEIVVTEGRTPAEAAAYRERRVRVEYPSLGL